MRGGEGIDEEDEEEEEVEEEGEKGALEGGFDERRVGSSSSEPSSCAEKERGEAEPVRGLALRG